MAVDGGSRRILTSAPGWHYVQCWSPDGRWLAVVSFTKDFASSETVAIRVADGRTVPLPTMPGARELAWARR